jgi:hypothetical protein
VKELLTEKELQKESRRLMGNKNESVKADKVNVIKFM